MCTRRRENKISDLAARHVAAYSYFNCVIRLAVGTTRKTKFYLLFNFSFHLISAFFFLLTHENVLQAFSDESKNKMGLKKIGKKSLMRPILCKDLHADLEFFYSIKGCSIYIAVSCRQAFGV